MGADDSDFLAGFFEICRLQAFLVSAAPPPMRLSPASSGIVIDGVGGAGRPIGSLPTEPGVAIGPAGIGRDRRGQPFGDPGLMPINGGGGHVMHW
jgi:hypothetical protein